jgi:stage II sporulation protein AA (anti-sigma F factor antagonist)
MNGESASRSLTWPLRLKDGRSGDVVIVELAGRLGQRSTDELSASLTALINDGARRMVLDLGGLDYISSAGLLAIDGARAHLEAVSGVMVLCDLPEPVRIVFDLAGFLAHYAVEPSRERAIATVLDGRR